MNPFHLSFSSSSVAVAGVVVPVLPCGLARCRGMLRPDDLIASGPILRPSRPARLGFRPPFFYLLFLPRRRPLLPLVSWLSWSWWSRPFRS